MPPSKRAAQRPQEPIPLRRREPERQVGVHVHNGRRTPRVARVAIYDRHLELVLGGFEVGDLSDLKDRFGMRWVKEDSVWVLGKRDLDDLLDELESMRFIVRVLDYEDR